MTFFLAAGIGLIVFGVTLTDRGAGTDPAKQFTKHVDGCQVVSYTTEARDKKATNKDRSNRCQDFYNYTAIFKSGAPSSEPWTTGMVSSGDRETTDKEKESKGKHGGHCADNDASPLKPRFAVNETTTCWSPVSTLSDDHHELYRCRNPECYELFDPAAAVVMAKNSAGWVLAFGSICCCCSLLQFTSAVASYQQNGYII